VDYWRNFGGQGNKFRFLDFPRKSALIGGAFGGGNLAALADVSTGFSPETGVMFCQSHDENPPGKLDLAYAYILTRVGLPVVFFTGNNLAGSEANLKTWMKTGYGSALGDYNYGAVSNMVFVNQQFARAREWNRWSESDFFAFERYDDTVAANASPDAGEGLLLVGLNDSGAWLTRNNVQTAFEPGTVLKDYSIYGSGDLTVNGSGQVNLSIPPGNNGQGWCFYAPRIPEGDADGLRFQVGGNPAPTMPWVVPGGRLATTKQRPMVRLTEDTVDIDVHYQNAADSAVNAVMVKWGQGQRMHATNFFSTGVDSVSGKFQSANPVSVGGNGGVGQFRLTATLTNLTEGLHLVQGRAFVGRAGNRPALFNTFREVVYVDRRGPDLHLPYPAANQTVEGSTVCTVTNSDRTAYYMEYSVNGGAYTFCDEVQKGQWRFALPDLAAGTHTVAVRALEADWGNPRTVINTSTLSRVFNVSAPGPVIALNHAASATLQRPFFATTITTPGLTPADVKLYWDGYELAGVSGSGTLSHTFDGRYLTGGVTQQLYGAFVNGPHYFEVVASSAGTTTRVTRRVVFNLYGNNQIDSDGDGLPDEVEMPNFFAGTAPGPNVPWPGDTSGSGNQDMIPNYGETWSRLNPMNADTTYNGTWDGDEDWDGDGYPNLCEVVQGYLEFGNPYHYNIYNSGSKPTTCPGTLSSQASWSPTVPTNCPGNTLTITYAPLEGPLSNASPIQIYIGVNGFTNITTNTMNSIGDGQWQYQFPVLGLATQINFVFRDTGGTNWDNNGGANWNVAVRGCSAAVNYFVMDGTNDSPSYVVAESGMKLMAAVKGSNLYVATWSPAGSTNGSDHFLYVTDDFGPPVAAPWAKAGQVYFARATKPYLAGESAVSGGYHAFVNSGNNGRWAMGAGGQVLEGELNLIEVFGHMPEKVYLAAVAMGDLDGGGIGSQCPPLYGNEANDVEITEFLAVPLASIRDENLDGVFDAGQPQLWTVVDGNTNDANYNIRRFFLDEMAGESRSLTAILQINGPGGTNVVSEVELFSNLNRRDFAVLPGDEDPDAVTTSSATTYYRAYAMSGSGNGPYTATLPVTKCGAYRINARYKINGVRHYYTDHGLRRDCAVVVTPKKALNITMYELNPLTAEATSDDFFGRSTFRDIYQVNTNKPDAVSTNYFKQLGVNMLWLQPIHPIGSDNREKDPATGADYDPGSPYAVRNYWQVNGVLGDPWTSDGSQAMTEFQEFVAAMDQNGIGVMLDGTFNHSAWDAEVGEKAVELFPWAASATDLIRTERPAWYSRKGNHGLPATYYSSAADNDIATAPDRIDFGKWSDVADFFFGTYDALVQGQTDAWRFRYLMQEDRFDGFATNATRELWQYFAEYPLYWLEKTGHPAGTPKGQSSKGIDGLRCDFAQGLPSEFWEYTINRTRSVKWDFLFMAESLDGYREINGNKRNGLSFRSARHFDILNENLVFYWRDSFFDYKPFGGGVPFSGQQPFTFPTWQNFDNRRNAYDVCPILLNLTGHDELLPHDDQWRLIYAYAILNTQDGAPMLFAGQENGLQNSATVYTNRGIDAANNYARYETNFGKGIAHFKRYNHLTNVWGAAVWKTPMHEAYQRINRARLSSPALRSQQNYMLAGTNGWNPDIYGIAKFEAPGVPAASQDVVFAFVNNNYQGSANRYDTYALNAVYNGGPNWFGIEAGKTYNIVDLASPTPTNYLWSPSKTANELLTGGLTVLLNGNPYQGQQVQYLKLIDTSATYPDSDGDGLPDYSDSDDDNDGLPDWWEALYGNRAGGADDDGDGLDNVAEYQAGTNPTNGNSTLELGLVMTGATARVSWDAVVEKNYRVQKATSLQGASWQQVYFGTALSTNEALSETASGSVTTQFYRVQLQP
jgi:glycosidase